jgi:hypothetical protein
MSERARIRRKTAEPAALGRGVLIPPHDLAVLREAAADALTARRMPREAIEVLLGTLTFLAALPSGRQSYRPSLGNRDLVAAYLRLKYGTRRRAMGALFVDREFSLLAEDNFHPRAEMCAEGERLIDAAAKCGAHSIIVFRYFRVRKNLVDTTDVEFTRHMQDALQGRSGIRFLDYLLLTPLKYASVDDLCKTVDSVGKEE